MHAPTQRSVPALGASDGDGAAHRPTRADRLEAEDVGAGRHHLDVPAPLHAGHHAAGIPYHGPGLEHCLHTQLPVLEGAAVLLSLGVLLQVLVPTVNVANAVHGEVHLEACLRWLSSPRVPARPPAHLELHGGDELARDGAGDCAVCAGRPSVNAVDRGVRLREHVAAEAPVLCIAVR
jgi:hypothetical protein